MTLKIPQDGMVMEIKLHIIKIDLVEG